jgi:fermentation-respiration switch protein FrsA (DUF1100 family)
MMPFAPHSLRRLLSRRVLTRVAIGLVAGYVALTVTLLALEDRLLFHPVRAGQRWIDPPPGCAAQDVEFRTAAGTLIHARWYPCRDARGAVLICHSRSGNLNCALSAEEVTGWQRGLGQSVLVFDYPGYGRSAGSPSEAGCYAAAEAAYDWLTRARKVPPQRVLIYGRSLGTAVAVELASRRPHRALVLVSPFTSLPDVALSHLPFLPARQLMRNRFDSLTRIGRCSQPVFMVHGTHDRLVPFVLGERLFAAANAPRRLLPVAGAHHGNCITTAFFPALRRFLAEVEAPRLGPAAR